MTIASVVNLLFKSVLGGALAFGGFYMAIEEQHKAAADWRIELAGIGLALLGLFTAPYAGPALQNGGDQLSRFGRRAYDRYSSAKAGTPVTDEQTVPEVKK